MRHGKGSLRASRRTVRRARRRRTGLVLGAGGPLGVAWSAGVLAGLQGRLEVPLGAVDVLVGTSSGSILACALRCGLDADVIATHQGQ